MSFAVPADAYDLYTAAIRWGLTPLFAHFVGVPLWQRVLDVGWGPGALAAQLASTVGAQLVGG